MRTWLWPFRIARVYPCTPANSASNPPVARMFEKPIPGEQSARLTAANVWRFQQQISLAPTGRILKPHLQAAKVQRGVYVNRAMEPSQFRPSPRGQESDARLRACLRRGSPARVVKGSLPRSALKEPSPGFPNPIFRPSNANGNQPGWERIGAGDGHFHFGEIFGMKRQKAVGIGESAAESAAEGRRHRRRSSR